MEWRKKKGEKILLLVLSSEVKSEQELQRFLELYINMGKLLAHWSANLEATECKPKDYNENTTPH